MAPAAPARWQKLDASRAGTSFLMLWRDDIRAIANDEGAVTEHAAELASLARSALSRSSVSRAAGREMAETLRQLCRCALFAKALSSQLVRLTPAGLAPSSLRRALTWTSIAMASLPAGTSPKALASLVESASGLLRALLAAPQRGAQTARRVEAAAASLQISEPAWQAAVAADVLTPEICLSAAVRGLPGWETPCLALLCEQALAAKDAPGPGTLAAWHGVGARLGLPALSESLAPAANKAVRRSPDAPLLVLEAVLRGASEAAPREEIQDAAPIAAGLLASLGAPLIPLTRHAREGVRDSACACLRALSRLAFGCGAQDALRERLTQPLIAVLSGSGRAKAASERQAAARGLLACARGALPGGAAAQDDLARGCVEALAGAQAQEPAGEALAAVAEALGAWASLAPDEPSCAAALALWAGGLKDKEPVRKLCLLSVARALWGPGEGIGLADVPTVLGSTATFRSALAPGLLELVREASAKAALRPDGLLALSCLAAGDWGAARAPGLAAQLLALVDDAASTLDGAAAGLAALFAPAVLARLSAWEAAAAARAAGLCLALLQGSEAATARAALCRALIVLGLHASSRARLQALRACRSLAAAPSPATELLRALCEAARRPRSLGPALPTLAEDPDAPPSMAALGARWAALLRACAACARGSQAGALPPEFFILAAAAAHAPVAAAARNEGGSAVLDAALGADAAAEGGAPALAQALVCAAAAAAAEGGAADAEAARALCARFPCDLPRAVLREANARGLLDAAAHDALSLRALRIFFAPPGRLSNETEEGSILPTEIFESLLLKGGAQPAQASLGAPGTRLALAPRAAGASEASAPALARPQARPSHAAPPAKARPAPPRDATQEARAAQLGEEAERREAVRGLQRRLRAGLGLLAVAAEALERPSAEEVEAWTAPALALLESPLVAGEALRALAGVARALSPPLPRAAVDLAAARKLAQAALRAGPGGGGGRQPPPRLPAGGASAGRAVSALCVAAGGAAADSRSRPEAAEEAEEEAEEVALSPVEALEARPCARPLSPGAVAFAAPILLSALGEAGPSWMHLAALQLLTLAARAQARGRREARPEPREALPLDVALAMPRLCALLERAPVWRSRCGKCLVELCAALTLDARALDATLRCLRCESAVVRAGLLSALAEAPVVVRDLSAALSAASPSRPALELASALWMLRHDAEPEVAQRAAAVWAERELGLPYETMDPPRQGASKGPPPFLHGCLADASESVRGAAARALAQGLVVHPRAAPALVDACLAALQQAGGKAGGAAALTAVAPLLPPPERQRALSFLLQRGCMCESDVAARAAIVAAGAALVDAGGEAEAELTLPLLERALAPEGQPSWAGEAQRDGGRQGASVLLGALATHLPAAHPRVAGIHAALEDLLEVPSEAVQRAAAEKLGLLLARRRDADPDSVGATVRRLLDALLGSASVSFARRKGAAYGVAGAVSGLGLSSLKSLGVTEALRNALELTPGVNAAKEGALLGYECLALSLHRLFEPYVVSALPLILAALSSSSGTVRAAALSAARVCLARLSPAGVRLALPALLGGLEDAAAPWRAREASMQMLGGLAAEAPRALRGVLPALVPALGDALGDAQPRVAQAAKEALHKVSKSVANPEVARLAPLLLKAIADPPKHTRKALDALLATVFVSSMDVAGLALVMPPLERGLCDRAGEVKQRAARVLGALGAVLTDAEDLAPYLPKALPALSVALGDPLPDVRSAAARCVGSLVSSLGSRVAKEVAPSLQRSLLEGSTAVERAGAAHGLSELLAAQGPEALSAGLEDALRHSESRSASAREGVLALLRFLPRAAPEAFKPHLARALPALLGGLADEAEGVRDAALLAARVCVDLYAAADLEAVLPAMEGGMASGNWRIREASASLLGDALFRVVGTSGKVQQDTASEAEGLGAAQHAAALKAALPPDLRARVLARLYVARSDAAAPVRVAAMHVWKTVVDNTPRTLHEVLPTMIGLLLDGLAADSEDANEAAGRCLADLVLKMADRVLPQILPLLTQACADRDSPSLRRAACAGAAQVARAAGKDAHAAARAQELLPAVRGALGDADAGVRAAAADALDALLRAGDRGSVDAVVPALLAGLDGEAEAAERAVEGLRVLLAARHSLFNALAPRLLQQPHSPARVAAVGMLAGSAGPALAHQLGAICGALLPLSSQVLREEAAAGEDGGAGQAGAPAVATQALKRVVQAVSEDAGHVLLSLLYRACEVESTAPAAAAALLAWTWSARSCVAEHADSVLQQALPLLAAREELVAQPAREALGAAVAAIPKEELDRHVGPARQGLAAAKERMLREMLKEDPSSERSQGHLLGLSPPKSLAPILPVFVQGVLQTHSTELREQAALGVAELVALAGPDALRSAVVGLAGPLIRVAGDRGPASTKAAVLKALELLLSRVGAALKPFVPQLQTTFAKALADPEARVWSCAARALGSLSALALRKDALAAELAASARAAGAPAALQPWLVALRGVLAAAGGALSQETLAEVGAALAELRKRCAAAEEEGPARALAAASVEWSLRVPAAQAAGLLRDEGLLSKDCPPALLQAPPARRLGCALVAAGAARGLAGECAQARADLAQALKARFVKDQSPDVRAATAVAAVRLLDAELRQSDEDGAPAPSPTARLLAALAVGFLAPDQASDTQRAAMAALRGACADGEAVDRLAVFGDDLVPALLRAVQDSAGTTRLAAERTVARVLALQRGPERAQALLAGGKAGTLAKNMLTDIYCRRLSKLPQNEEYDDLWDV